MKTKLTITLPLPLKGDYLQTIHCIGIKEYDIQVTGATHSVLVTEGQKAVFQYRKKQGWVPIIHCWLNKKMIPSAPIKIPAGLLPLNWKSRGFLGYRK